MEAGQTRPRRPGEHPQRRRPEDDGPRCPAPAAEVAPRHPGFLRRPEPALHHRIAVYLLTNFLVTSAEGVEVVLGQRGIADVEEPELVPRECPNEAARGRFEQFAYVKRIPASAPSLAVATRRLHPSGVKASRVTYET